MTPLVKTIHLIKPQAYSGAFNMAADLWMLGQEGSWLRFYAWDRPTLSLGKSTKSMAGLDLEFCRQAGIPLVRRPTGGKEVLHHLELTYAFATDKAHFPTSILESYQVISQALALGLKHLGLKTGMEKAKRPLERSSICFQEVSSYELAVEGKKLVGSAQVRSKTRLLQHGSLLLDIDWPLWQGVWGLKDHQDLDQRITCLKACLPQVPSREELAEHLAHGFLERFSAKVQPFDLAQAKVKLPKSPDLG